MKITEEILKNARILLSKNGNTVKATVQGLDKSSENLVFLHALLGVEQEGKARSGVLNAIGEAIMEQ